MTRSTTTVKAVSDGTVADPRHDKPKHGVRVLRDREAMALISVGCDAISEAACLGHAMHTAIYDKDSDVPETELQELLLDALTCLESADHYLRMFSSVLDERTADSQAPWPADPAL